MTLAGGIHRLMRRNFKARFALGRDLGLEFMPKKGFVSCEMPDQTAAADAMKAIIEIVNAYPVADRSNGSGHWQQAQDQRVRLRMAPSNGNLESGGKYS